MVALICWAGAVNTAAQTRAIAPKPIPNRARIRLTNFVDIIPNVTRRSVSLASKSLGDRTQPLTRMVNRSRERNCGLAFLLLACLAWGVTAEFTHQHGTQLQNSAVRNINADQSSARFQTPNDRGRSSTSQSQIECSICQLHQNLSSTELNQPGGIDATEARISHSLTNISVHPSETANTQHDRAPPESL